MIKVSVCNNEPLPVDWQESFRIQKTSSVHSDWLSSRVTRPLALLGWEGRGQVGGAPGVTGRFPQTMRLAFNGSIYRLQEGILLITMKSILIGIHR